ncbi:MAG: lysophospholipid acyltransferase family protein [Candidatus Symbiothrix sp.]|jgi:KDO2-lipid IV(A) lauroyltransferase|nr:lysophospholipid acyltransferase family protein [Candidatus Symbiothrix sp.]
MKSKIAYIFLYAWAKAHAWLPVSVLYILADILYVLVYKVMRYRVRMVRNNMKASFPQKTEAERKCLERGFYHYFSDYIVELLKQAHVSKEEMLARAHITNPELIDRLVDEGYTCIAVFLGHYGNWEWFPASNTVFRSACMYPIYRPLNNKAFDKLITNFRTRFGVHLIEKHSTSKSIIQLKLDKTPSMVFFLADQNPGRDYLEYWSTFLNRDTPVLTGPEKIARRLELPVVFADMTVVKRGQYSFAFKLLTKTPQSTPEFWVTETYIRLMEESILKNPSYWLWTHNRWKYKREQNA